MSSDTPLFDEVSIKTGSTPAMSEDDSVVHDDDLDHEVLEDNEDIEAAETPENQRLSAFVTPAEDDDEVDGNNSLNGGK